MQYLLTEKEYAGLCNAGVDYEASVRDALQKACTLAAKHTPITRDWAPDAPPIPWGCILDEEPKPQHRTPYCDNCPVQEICPHDGKEWSK